MTAKEEQNQQAEEPPDTEKKLLFLLYIKGVSEKIERIGFPLQITPIFKSMNTLRQSTDEGEVKQTRQDEERCGLYISIHRQDWSLTANMLSGHS